MVLAIWLAGGAVVTMHSQDKAWDAGLEFQAYPTGLIPGIYVSTSMAGLYALDIRVGYNIVRHRDLGKHDDERGGGFGGSIGVLRLFKPEKGWFIDVRSDVWFNTLDWKDTAPPVEDNGTSDVIVLQPTARIGYAFTPGSGNVVIRPTLGIGIEINMHTTGEDVGEGLIGLAGIQFGYIIW